MSDQASNPAIPSDQMPLNRMQIRKALRLWSVEGSVTVVQTTLTSGVIQTGFAIYLGCSDFIISLLAAIPAFVGLLQLFSSYFAQRYGNRKAIVRYTCAASRLLWLPMLLIPFSMLPHKAWVPAFLLLTLLSSALINIANPLWTAWISDLVPENHRGRYFGVKNMYGGIVGMLASVAAGYFLDAVKKHRLLTDPAAFGTLFGISVLCGIVSFFLGGASPDVPGGGTANAEDLSSGTRAAIAYYKKPFVDKNFLKIIMFYAGFLVAQSIAGQFFVVNQIKYLRLNYTAFQLLAAVSSLASLAVMPLWGYLADKYGNKPILMISCALVIIPPFQWLLSSPDGIPGLWMFDAHHVLHISYDKLNIAVLNTIAGVGWAGVGLTQFNMMIGEAPPENRTVYVSAIAAVSGLAGGIAPVAGGALLTLMRHVTFPTHGPIRNGYHVLFVISGILRAGFLLMLPGIDERGSTTTGYVLGQLRSSRPLASITNIRKLTRPNSAVERQRAAQNLARIKSPVAVEELVKALDDVSLPVREQAALALGEIGDVRALPSLVAKLKDPAAGITSHAAIALGKIGSGVAFPALAAAAQLGPPSRQLAAIEALGQMEDTRVTGILVLLASNHDPAVRVVAIRSLSEREDPDSEIALVARLKLETDHATIAVISDSLGRLGTGYSISPLLDALRGSSSPTVRKAILNSLGSLVGGRDAFYPILALDPHARDEMVSKMLISIQKRYRRSQPNFDANDVAALCRHAVVSYAQNDIYSCLAKASEISCVIISDAQSQTSRSNLTIPTEIKRQIDDTEQDVTMDELLLCLFILSRVSDGSRER